MTEYQRASTWVKATHRTAGILMAKATPKDVATFAVMTIQQLARVDAHLRATDPSHPSVGAADPNCTPWSGTLDYHGTLAWLWLLGAYELVRTLDQAAGFGNSAGLATLKRKLERLRMPIAKLEAPKRDPSGGPIAYPGLSAGSVAWHLADGTVFTRTDLADELLAAVLAM